MPVPDPKPDIICIIYHNLPHSSTTSLEKCHVAIEYRAQGVVMQQRKKQKQVYAVKVAYKQGNRFSC